MKKFLFILLVCVGCHDNSMRTIELLNDKGEVFKKWTTTETITQRENFIVFSSDGKIYKIQSNNIIISKDKIYE